MTAPLEGYPSVGVDGLELRFTQRALVELRVRRNLDPGDIAAVRATTPWPAIVDDFANQRVLAPTGTRGPMRNMGRNDIYELSAPDGCRAATWVDKDHRVCWFLGFTPHHDFAPLERRAANDELLPTAEDRRLLEAEVELQEFDERVGPGLRVLVQGAVAEPRVAVRGTVGALVRLAVAAVVERVGTSKLADLYIAVCLPPAIVGAVRPRDWPGPLLPERLAALATASESWELATSLRMPDGKCDRPIDPAKELVVVVRNWEFGESESGATVGAAVPDAWPEDRVGFVDRVARGAPIGGPRLRNDQWRSNLGRGDRLEQWMRLRGGWRLDVTGRVSQQHAALTS